MQIDRRDFVKLGALAAAARIEAAATPCVAAPTPLHAMKICNTAYYPAARDLLSLSPGTPLGMGFDYSPQRPNAASAAFHYNGQKVGDAPRAHRAMLGRMLLGGRKLDAVLDRLRPPTEYDDWAAHALVRLHHGEVLKSIRRRVDEDFMQDVAEDLNAQRFVRLVGEASGLEPVFMAAGRIQTATRDEAFIGQPLRIKPCIDRCMMTFAYETLEGRRLGVDHSMSGKLIGRMAEAGLILGAVVLPGPPWNKQLWASAYLIS